MSRTIWTRCAGDSEIRPLVVRAHRAVESQSVISTRKLVDSDAEQALLEDLVDRVKPRAPSSSRFASLHYLLATPFRYPPLRHGSRFGARDERGLFYAAVAVETALAETAYYRLLFLEHSEAELGLLTTELTTFVAHVRATRGVDLTSAAFARFDARIHSATDYAASQPLGRAMRAAGVEAFLFRSARDPGRGVNLGLFEPVFAKKKPTGFASWVALAEKGRVEILLRSAAEPRRLVFPRAVFEVDGALPDPGNPGADGRASGASARRPTTKRRARAAQGPK